MKAPELSGREVNADGIMTGAGLPHARCRVRQWKTAPCAASRMHPEMTRLRGRNWVRLRRAARRTTRGERRSARQIRLAFTAVVKFRAAANIAVVAVFGGACGRGGGRGGQELPRIRTLAREGRVDAAVEVQLGERELSREELEEDEPQGVHVAPPVGAPRALGEFLR